MVCLIGSVRNLRSSAAVIDSLRAMHVIHNQLSLYSVGDYFSVNDELLERKPDLSIAEILESSQAILCTNGSRGT